MVILYDKDRSKNHPGHVGLCSPSGVLQRLNHIIESVIFLSPIFVVCLEIGQTQWWQGALIMRQTGQGDSSCKYIALA